MKKILDSKDFRIMLKIILTLVVLYISIEASLAMLLYLDQVSEVMYVFIIILLPSLFVPLIWIKNKTKYLKAWSIIVVLFIGIYFGITKYDESITIDVVPNIKVDEYLPFEEESKIVKIDSKTLKLKDDLPIVDGAAALFPVYSAFVNAVYPNDTKLDESVFLYNNTSSGYRLLAEKETDIFFGAYPSEEQIEDAEENNTTFEYTPICLDAFVFLVHKDNPIENLTTEQIQGIYAGEITNWREVGGSNEKIVAFQRNAGSGSQSMLKRFMGDKPIMDPPKEWVNDFMSGMIEVVSDYRSKTSSIGYSFRYYAEEIIKNPDIKLLSIDGVEPSVENIRNGSYPIVTPFYAVTYKENKNKNVDKLIEWILSEEGQYIIEETGYVGR